MFNFCEFLWEHPSRNCYHLGVLFMGPRFLINDSSQTQLSFWSKTSIFILTLVLTACGGSTSKKSSDETGVVAPLPVENISDPAEETPAPSEESYQVSLIVSESTITEGASSTLTFSLNKINDSGESILIYFTHSGSADQQEDYETLGQSIEIAPNTLSTNLMLNTLDDSIVEPTELLQITLNNNSLPDNLSLSANTTVTISIRDNDTAQEAYDLTTREGSQAFYENEYLGSAFSSNGWIGKDDSSCNEGTIPRDVKDKTTRRINYYRTLVGVNTIDHDATLDTKAQKGAHVSQIQFDLGVTLTSAFHVPSDENGDWVCLDADAIEAMGNSSIAQVGNSWNAAGTIDLFIWDPGAHNSSAGHRDNIFRSDLSAVGIGATNQAVLIMAENSGNPTGMWQWPPALYVPTDILYDWEDFSRWSVRNEKAFIKWKNKTTNGAVTPAITVTNCDGDNITVQNIKLADNKLLTWEVDANTSAIVDECTYQVNISDYYLVEKEGDGAATGSLTTLSYELTLFKAE